MLRSNYYVGVALAHAQRTWTLRAHCGSRNAEKTFADGSETTKYAKVFSLESFPLYDSRKSIVFNCELRVIIVSL